MNTFVDPCLFGTPSKRVFTKSGKIAVMILILSAFAASTFAQTVTWSDSFSGGEAPSTTQCQNWTDFLDQLGGKRFASVTISGTFDETGITITDPDAATQLAQLLNSRTGGIVTSGDHYWRVGTCYQGACGSLSIMLSVDGNKADCDCLDTYAIKPHSQTSDWGGINTPSCDAPSQTMKLVFQSGVSVIANGPTTICPGESVELSASSQLCAGPYTYLWSNGETTETITVTESGDYSVTVSGPNSCNGVSSPITVAVSESIVDAGQAEVFCDMPVQLHATVPGSAESVTSLCMFNAPGGPNNCDFAFDLCTEEVISVNNQTFPSGYTGSLPSEVVFELYYSPFTYVSTFSFIVNGQVIGTYIDTDPTGTCDPAPFGQYPREVSFNRSQLSQSWKETGENTIEVQVVGDGYGVALAGIKARVIVTNETYSWSPATGLSDASIKNPLASPEETTTYTVTYTNADGCTSTDQVEVKVNCNTAPIAVCKPLTVSVDGNCEAIVSASDFDAGSTSNSAGELTFTVSPAGPYPIGETQLTLTVTDANGLSSSCQTTVTVLDTTPPVIATPDDVIVTNIEGVCAANVALQAPAATDNCGIKDVSPDQAVDVFPVGEHFVTWTATDLHGNTQTVVQRVVVTNVEPVIASVTPSASTVEANNPVSLGVIYADNNVKSATIEWGDSGAPEVIPNPQKEFSASHTYAASGAYPVTVTLTDLCDVSTSYVYESITVFEKRTGSVAGNGWFYSEAGYYLKDKRAAGKAQYAFEAEYNSNNTVPVGNATFKFKAGKLDFRSTEYELLRIDGASAFLTGTGRLNGKGGYKLLIALVDAQNAVSETFVTAEKGKGGKKNPDRIRVRITDPKGVVVYDTQVGAANDAMPSTAIGGGSIEVNENETSQQSIEDLIDTYFGEEATSVYPNPFVDAIEVNFNATSQEMITMQLSDLAGRVVHTAQFEVSADGSYSLNIPEGKRPGIYILKIQQGARVEFFPLIHK